MEVVDRRVQELKRLIRMCAQLDELLKGIQATAERPPYLGSSR
jgi:hypothetical protein